MVISMLLAHLVGDFILQWDALAQWKSRELAGVAGHAVVVLLVTWLFALPFDPTWWWGVLFIGLAHFLVDAIQFYWRPCIPPIARFALDQTAHLTIILLALIAGGYLRVGSLMPDMVEAAQATPRLTMLLGYAFITMPAWVLLKFTTYGLVKGCAPNFPAGPNKFVGITERVLITTLVVLGQVLLVPLVALPRLIRDWRLAAGDGRDPIYLPELIASAGLAVAVGLALRLFLL
jgi:hypothetical protein